MFLPLLVRISAVIAPTVLASSVAAAGLHPATFEEQVAEADLVVFAERKKGSRSKPDLTGQLELTELRVHRVLKGNLNGNRIWLVTTGEVAELDPNCCMARATYLLLLKKGNGNVYETLNGRHGAIIVK